MADTKKTKVVTGSGSPIAQIGHAKMGGRVAGTPNKSTTEARQAIALFVDSNAHRLTEWLDKVANGDPEGDVKPNPAKAFELFQSVVEYHVPKLARSELVGKDGADLNLAIYVKFD